MNDDFLNEDIMNGAKIAIVGVGGGGNNAVNKMVEDDMKGLTFIIANTDIQVLKTSPIEKRIVLGKDLTKGLGAGANPDIGEKSANDSIEEIRKAVEGYDLVFVAAGMGGGTGTGAAPIIAKVAKDTGALVVGIVTTPFVFEGKRRMQNAVIGLEEFKKNVDSIIIISNDRLKMELGTIPLMESFQYSDAILKQAVRTITDLINSHSLINLDFADVRTVIEQQGLALIGVGRSSSEDKAKEAALAAINSPILESSIEGAKNAIVNIAGSSTGLSIEQANTAIETIKENAGDGLDIIFGVTINDALEEEIVVSVIATGLSVTKSERIKIARINSENGKEVSKYRKVTRQLNEVRMYDEVTEEFEAIRDEKTKSIAEKQTKKLEQLKQQAANQKNADKEKKSYDPANIDSYKVNMNDSQKNKEQSTSEVVHQDKAANSLENQKTSYVDLAQKHNEPVQGQGQSYQNPQQPVQGQYQQQPVQGQYQQPVQGQYQQPIQGQGQSYQNPQQPVQGQYQQPVQGQYQQPVQEQYQQPVQGQYQQPVQEQDQSYQNPQQPIQEQYQKPVQEESKNLGNNDDDYIEDSFTNERLLEFDLFDDDTKEFEVF